MGLRRTAAPAALLTTAEGKKQLEIPTAETAHDDYVDTLIKAAVEQLEDYTKRAFLTQTWELTLDRFPGGREPIYVPRPPLASVTSIYYLDEDGNSTLWASSLYRVITSTKPGKIVPVYNGSYPTTRDELQAVTITYVAGETTAAAVSEMVKHAVKVAITEWFENRGEAELPQAAKNLVSRLVCGVHSGGIAVE